MMEALFSILAGVAIAGFTVWAVERLAEERSRRDRQIEALEQTLRQMIAMLAEAGAQVAGPGATLPGRYDTDAYPRGDPLLVGDIDALRIYYVTLREFHERDAGSGYRVSDATRESGAAGAIRNAVAAQERRVLDRKPLKQLSAADKATLGELVIAVTAAIRDAATRREQSGTE